ncbi:type I-B CRISPR-associated protein Cas5b [Desulfobacula toluolica]|uniref:Cas5: CRISPR-associated protein, Hmari subtype n=1 Tax=Desulfobacula toluolica (strain DSM 7467 / Tol2) TaxID=651182 RepID=K0NJU5_DESTT|nr:type I-B CRISPR-associated protein Cas5b [Desulfobacula toluolica]CCK81115.1 Cas5: CRISPR-associated protein, Hmari subtype [Desulfobacula toluolica Tol2]
MTKVLVFKLWGDYGHFKKFYTTTSPLTFEFPPPVTVLGIVSAIIGLDKDSYLENFIDPTRCHLAIGLERPVKKVRWTQNLIDTKRNFWKIHNRTQIRTEFLKDPGFKFFFSHKNPEIYDQLKENLMAHKSYYTISLGLSELLADFEFCGEQTITPSTTDEWQSIQSVVPCSALQDDQSIDFEEGKEIFKISYPVEMIPNRVVTRREDVIFERRGLPVTCRVKEVFKTEEGEKIVFF